jgi:hypothetical protein
VTGVAQGEVDFAATLVTVGPAEGAKGTYYYLTTYTCYSFEFILQSSMSLPFACPLPFVQIPFREPPGFQPFSLNLGEDSHVEA